MTTRAVDIDVRLSTSSCDSDYLELPKPFSGAMSRLTTAEEESSWRSSLSGVGLRCGLGGDN